MRKLEGIRLLPSFRAGRVFNGVILSAFAAVNALAGVRVEEMCATFGNDGFVCGWRALLFEIL